MRFIWKIGIPLLCCIGLALPIFATQKMTEWGLVQKAMQQQSGANTALQLLNRSAKMGPVNADLAYNLGTAYLMTGQTGNAIWYLETALEMRPRDQDIRNNLASAQQKVKGISTATPVWDAYLSLGRWMTLGEVAWIWLVATLSMVVLMLMSSLGRCHIKYVRWALLVWGVLSVPVGIRTWDAVTPRAVVIHKMKLRVSPDLDAVTISDVPSGTVGRITGYQVGWIQIQLPDGATGWGVRGDIRSL
jgi:hypothetical protein